jgi:hypothetical protein
LLNKKEKLVGKHLNRQTRSDKKMKISNNLVKVLPLAAAALVAGGFSATATTVDLTIINSFPLAETGFGAVIPNGPNSISPGAPVFNQPGFGAGGTMVAIGSSDLIGLYSFTVNNNGGDTTLPSVLVSTCLSPSGNLDYGTHAYVEESFAQASPGFNPPAWSVPNGIVNASYLWRHFSASVIASNNANEGAALMLAMWDALYNSTGVGTLDASGGSAAAVSAGSISGYKITSWSGNGPAVQAWFNTFVGGVGGAALVPPTTGTILRDAAYALPTGRNTGIDANDGAGQDLIFNTTPIPEPSTLIAGGLLLLPFGASTLRFIRKNKTA